MDVGDVAKTEVPDSEDVTLIGESNCAEPLRVETVKVGAGQRNKGASESVELLRECDTLSASDDTCSSMMGDCDKLDVGFEDIGTTMLSNLGSDLSGTFISLITEKGK